jgi:hypothetical protein
LVLWNKNIQVPKVNDSLKIEKPPNIGKNREFLMFYKWGPVEGGSQGTIPKIRRTTIFQILTWCKEHVEFSFYEQLTMNHFKGKDAPYV